MTPTTPLPDFNPLSAGFVDDPHSAYRRHREAEPVHFNARAGVWFLSRHADCGAMLRDSRFSASQGQAARTHGQALPDSMLTTDPPDHGRLRAPVARLLDQAAAERIGSRLVPFVDVLLDRAEQAGVIDAVGQLAAPSALFAFADLLELPAVSRARFCDAASASSAVLDPFASPAAFAAASEATRWLGSLFEVLLESRRAEPGDDLISDLAGLVDSAAISGAEMVQTCTLLVVGGVRPLESFLALAIRDLLSDVSPDGSRWQPGGSGRVGVDELLRHEPPIPFAARAPLLDVEFAGVPIRAGVPVVALLASANRDEAVFANADRLDLGRAPNPHLAFGAGPHLCLGAAVVRAASLAVLDSLFERFPSARAAPGSAAWDSSVVPRRLASFPVILAR